MADLENFGGGDFKHKPSKIESDFWAEIGNSNVFSAQKSGGFQKNKNKKVFTEIESDFSAETDSFTLVGGMHPEMEPNFSK